MSQSYALQVRGAAEVRWTSTLFHKAPNLYVEINIDHVTQRTRVIKRNLTPVWDESLTLSAQNPMSVINISVKHDTSKPLGKDPCIGKIDVEISALLRYCDNDQDVSLDLEAPDRQRGGVITVKLEPVDPHKVGVIAVKSATDDIKLRGVASMSNASRFVRGVDRVANADSSGLLKSLECVMSKLDLFVTIVDKAAKVHPYANFAWQVVSSLYKAMKGQLERDSKLVGLVQTMEDVYSFVEASESFQDKVHLLEDTISRLLKQTVECAIFIREYTGHGFTGRVVRQTFSDDSQKIEELSKSLTSLRQSLDSSNIVQGVFTSMRTLRGVETIVELESLKLLKPIQMDASSLSECLPGTRVEILKFITDWLTTPSEEQNVLWLHGLAGSGKSTISTTVSEYFRDMDRLGCFIFFDRNDPNHRDPNPVIRTIAYRLASFDARIRSAICAVVENDGSIVEAPLRKQFSRLLLEPLQSIGSRPMEGPVIIVIDALDECGEAKSRKNLLALLAVELIKLPSAFRFIITSRAESDISAAFSKKSNILEKELTISGRSNESDIHSFLHHEMVSVRQRHTILNLAPDWPGESAISDLLMRSAGLFIWASMAVNFITEGYDPQEQLQILLSADSHQRPEAALDALYETALDTAGKWDSQTFVADFYAVMSAVLVGRVLLSDETIDKILCSNGRAPSKFMLPRLRCLLQWSPGSPVRVLHTSFADYLTDPRRCGKKPWAIDLSIANQVLADSCLQRMNNELHFNMCDLESSHLANEDVSDLSERISTAIPAHLIYACQFWARHVQMAPPSHSLLSKIMDLMFKNLLYWLEVLSLTDKVNLASTALLKMAKWSRINNAEPGLVAFTIDASKFVTTFKDPISRSAPQIYLTALPFSPLESIVSEHFRHHFRHIISMQNGRAEHWPPCLLRLDDHTDSVVSVAFSPDSTLIVSGSRDQTIRVWDVETGDVVSGPFEGHSGFVTSVVFSPDGKRVISGSEDMTVRIWDMLTGSGVLKPLKGHKRSVTCVSVSADNARIVSGSEDSTVRVWDARTGEVVSELTATYISTITFVTFLGNRIVYASEESVRVWDLDTGHSTPVEVKGHARNRVTRLALSPDGKRVLCADWGPLYRIWDVETGTPISEPFSGYSSHPDTVTFSSDHKYITWADNFEHYSIHIRDAHLGHAITKTFEGHTGYIGCMAFSLDGRYLVSGSGDHTARVWDVGNNVNSRRLEDEAPRSIAFSPTGKQFVSGGRNNSVRIWDAGTGKAVSEPFLGHSKGVTSVAFSPDGRRVVSGSNDQTVRVWDVQTGHIVSVSERKASTIMSVAFSPDGRRVVSASWDQDNTFKRTEHGIFVWDAELGNAILGPFPRDTKGPRDFNSGVSKITSITFSPDGKSIVSGSWNSEILIWDADTGIAIRKFRTRSTIHSVAISPDSKWIAAGGVGAVEIWDVEAGVTSHSLAIEYQRTGSTSVSSVAFSPDGKNIVAGAENNTIRVFDAYTGATNLGPLNGHGSAVSCVVFSPDGKQVASSSWDGTIRFWDVEIAEMDPAKEGTIAGSSSDLPPHCIDSSSDGFTEKSNWKGGWILNSDSKALFWVPPWNRPKLWWPRNTLIISEEYTKLDLSKFVHGTSWRKCKGES